jgi:hypothetical protein
MQSLTRGFVVIDYCLHCHYLWLDAGEARSIGRFFTGPASLSTHRLTTPGLSVGASAGVSMPSLGGALEGTVEVLDLGTTAFDLVAGSVEAIGALFAWLDGLG